MKYRRVAFYIRLSDADEDVKAGIKDESNSITAQRELLYSYIKKSEEYTDAEVLEYFDDGYSGTGFSNRASFQTMLNDAGIGRFECILVKDFSRLGRDYIEVGNYLEFVFPTMGIRFISVNDNYDSNQNVGMTGGMDVAFRNLIYQLYSRDLSRKVKSARRNRNLNGEYTASYVPYGYRKDKYDKHKLVIDDTVSLYVKEIFDRIIAGDATTEIARSFNERGVPTRVSNQKTKTKYVPRNDMGDNLWDREAVYGIVNNEIYTGRLIQNKWEVKGFGDNKSYVRRKRDDWSIVDGAVPAIVSMEDFQKVQGILGSRRKSKSAYGSQKRGENLFTCGYCGRKLTNGAWHKDYICRMHNIGGNIRCKESRIKQEKAHQMVLQTVREFADLLLDRRTVSQSDVNKKSHLSVPSLEKDKERIENSVVELYKSYRAGDISKELYVAERKAAKDKILYIEEMIQRENSVQKESSGNQAENLLLSVDDADNGSFLVNEKIFEKYDGALLSKIIREVKVYGNDNIEVVFHSGDVFA